MIVIMIGSIHMELIFWL